MSNRSGATKVTAVFLCLLTLAITLPFSPAETLANTPLGAIVTTGTANVAGNAAPTGTSLFPGDKVVASNDPVLVNFSSGSRIEMTEAVATFGRDGKRLVVQAGHGLFRFRFTAGEGVQIDAGNYRFAADGKAASAGELGLNQNGEVAMTLSQGEFMMTNLGTGARSLVTPEQPLLATGQATQPKPGMSHAAIAALVAGVAGGGAALGLSLPKPTPKSPSAR